MVASALASIPRMGRRYPWRTLRLPELVGVGGACEILGIDKMSLWRWMQSGSGTPESSHGPHGTYMIPWARLWIPRPDDPTPGMSDSQRERRLALIDEWVELDGFSGAPVWARDDVERHHVEVGRQRARPMPVDQSRAARDGAARRPQPA